MQGEEPPGSFVAQTQDLLRQLLRHPQVQRRPYGPAFINPQSALDFLISDLLQDPGLATAVLMSGLDRELASSRPIVEIFDEFQTAHERTRRRHSVERFQRLPFGLALEAYRAIGIGSVSARRNNAYVNPEATEQVIKEIENAQSVDDVARALCQEPLSLTRSGRITSTYPNSDVRAIYNARLNDDAVQLSVVNLFRIDRQSQTFDDWQEVQPGAGGMEIVVDAAGPSSAKSIVSYDFLSQDFD